MIVDSDLAPGAARTAQQRPRRRRRVGRWIALGVCVALLVVAVCAVLLVRDAMVARSALTRAAAQVPVVADELRSGIALDADTDGAAPLADSSALAELRRQTSTARAATDGPLWWLAARAPVVGPSASAATDVALVLDEVTDEVLPPLAALADALSATTRTPDGGLDLEPLRAVAPTVSTAQDTIDAADARLARIDVDALPPELAEPVASLRDRVGELATATTTAERGAVLAPAMLGADEPRTYLLLSMSTAELRAGGGIPGALTLLRVDGGRVEVVRQVSAADVGPFDEPVLRLDPDDEAAYTGRLGMFVQDVTATPDFPTSARLAAEMWARAQGEQVDGVLATDPVALSFLLARTGPVEVPLSPPVAAALGRDMVEVSTENTVDVLLRRVYDVLDPQEADLFFADVAAELLSRATAEDVSPAALVAGSLQAATEHRLRLWSPRAPEQALLAGTVLAGAFDKGPRAGDAVGVFLTDHVSGKMSAYLDATLTHAGSECTADGRLDTLELSLASTAPEDAATSLPSYVAGLPGGASPPGTLRLGVTVAGPRGGETPRLERDGAPFGGEARGTHGRSVLATTVVLAPGEDTTLRLTVPASAGRTSAPTAGTGPDDTGAPAGRLEVWSTPTTTQGGLLDVEVPTCG